jgi:hypothetical protein
MSFLVTALALLLTPVDTAQPDTAEPASPLDKVTCKRTLETGSLIKGKKVCLTRREWNKIAENARAMGQQMQDDNSRIYIDN